MPIALLAGLAALPILAILVLMVGFRWSAARSGAIGLLMTLAIAWFAFGYGTRVLPELGVAVATGGALAEALFLALTILWIIFPALCIHELQTRTGAIEVLRQAMGQLSEDPRIVALLIAWFFVLFIEGAAGFGTSVALAAPFLVSAGFNRVEAVSIALVGHAVGVSFGAVGTPILPQMAVTPFTGLELAAVTANYHVLLGWIMPLVVMLLVSRAFPGGKPIGLTQWGWPIFAAAAFLLPFYLLATFIGPELPTLAGALLGALAFVVGLVMVRRRERQRGAGAATPGGAALLRAAAPYLALVALVLITRLIPPLRELLQGVTLSWSYAAFSGSMAVLYHPGTLLLLSFFAGALIQRASPEALKEAVGAVLGRLLPVTLALLAMLSLSRAMVHAGMIDTLALAAAGATGGYWPLFAPFVGTLGTFVTGSATASNILFTDFQQATAERLGMAPLPLLGAQGFGAAVGNIICPHNIVAASATVNLVGKEGEVLRRTLWVALLYAFLGGLLALLVFV
ncbi:L-lactate permease [Stutzerimonas tarimensis]|uniref:L-lactate permease n=1 Tax=Stutzerimonas tarimensis TaxID=1507735 RepID=A0ABV7TAH0_9GAMM